jgi:hypothetical protein
MAVPVVKRYIAEEEWYPVYELHRDADFLGKEVEIPESLVIQYARAWGEWKAVQTKLRKLYEKEN